MISPLLKRSVGDEVMLVLFGGFVSVSSFISAVRTNPEEKPRVLRSPKRRIAVMQPLTPSTHNFGVLLCG